MTTRALEPADYAWVLALSAANEVETGHIDAAWLDAMSRQWFAARVIDQAAYLIAFAPGAAYESPNFHWLCAREQGFVYVDRIVVAAAMRGRGLARALYQDLFALARAADARSVVCEVNFDPPNPGSDAFHARMDFTEIGRATLVNGKTVRYLKRDLG